MATLTITVSATKANKAKWAVGKFYNLQDLTDPENPVLRDATAAEVEQFMLQKVKQLWDSYDRQKRHKTSDDSATGF